MKLSQLVILSVVIGLSSSTFAAGALKCTGEDPVYGAMDITFNPQAMTVQARGTTFDMVAPKETEAPGITAISQPFALEKLGLIRLGLTYTDPVPTKVTVSYIDAKDGSIKASADFECS